MLQEPVKQALVLLLGEDNAKHIQTQEEALASLNSFLALQNLTDLGITDLKMLMEAAAVFSSTPQSLIFTKEVLNCLQKPVNIFENLDRAIESYEQKLVSPNGELLRGRTINQKKKLLFPKKYAAHRKLLASIEKAIKDHRPELRTAYLKRGVTLVRKTYAALTFNDIFELEGEIAGVVHFPQAKTFEEVREALPEDFIKYKHVVSKGKGKGNCITLQPCNLPDLITLLTTFDLEILGVKK